MQRWNPSPSFPRFDAIPLQALFLAKLPARPKQFSKKLFVFVRIRFQLFLCYAFVVGCDCLSEFPEFLSEEWSWTELELTTACSDLERALYVSTLGALTAPLILK